MITKTKLFLQRLLDRMFGHDFFVTYGHEDSGTFAADLTVILRDSRFSVFLDEDGGYYGGDLIDEGTQRFAGNARRLLVLAGPDALQSDWVLKEVTASQRKRRVQVVIDDPDRSMERAPVENPLKALLSGSKWLFREPGNANLDAIVLDLITGFSRFRRETRIVFAIAATTILIFLAAGAAAFFSYERELAQQRAEQQRLLATSGRLTTEVQAALRDEPPRRSDAVELARSAVRQTMSAGLTVPPPFEQALRDALAEAGGRPMACGDDGPDVAQAPVDIRRTGLLIALSEAPSFCLWRSDDLSFVGAVRSPELARQSWFRAEDRALALGKDGSVLFLHLIVPGAADVPHVVLEEFYAPDKFGELLQSTDDLLLNGRAVQYDWAADVLRVWRVPEDPGVRVEPWRIGLKATNFLPLPRAGGALIVLDPEQPSDLSADGYCFFDSAELGCLSVPRSLSGAPEGADVDEAGERLLVHSDEMLDVFSLGAARRQLGRLERETLGADVVFARFLPDRPEIFVMGANGAAAIWMPGEDTLDRLPTSHVIPAGSLDSWVSSDGRWLVVRDWLRAVIGYRIDADSGRAQRMYPLHTPLEAADRAATLGGGLVDAWRKDIFAFGRTDTDAAVVVPGDDSLAVHIRRMVGHDAVVTAISFGIDAQRLFTVDLDGTLRTWRLSVDEFSAVPIVLPLAPESRLIVPDTGNFGMLDAASVIVSPGPPPVLVMGYNQLHAYDVADLNDLSFTDTRRSVKLGDLPLRATPDFAIIEAATFPSAEAALNAGWDNAVLLGGRVIISFEPGVKRFDEYSPHGRDLAAPDGDAFLAQPAGTSADDSALFLFTESGRFCRLDVTLGNEVTRCAVPSSEAATDGKNFDILEVTPNRFVVDLGEVIDVDWEQGTYDVSSMERPPGFCSQYGLLGASTRYIHFACDENVVVYDLGKSEPSRFLFKADDTVTGVQLDRGEDGALVAVGTGVGSLTAFAISDSAGRNKTLDPIAKGRFSSPTSIGAIAMSAATDAILTGDASGNVWRWELLDEQPDGRRELVPTVRLMHHHGTVSVVDFIENPADGAAWVVSAAADYKVMLSPLGIPSLLMIADKVVD